MLFQARKPSAPSQAGGVGDGVDGGAHVRAAAQIGEPSIGQGLIGSAGFDGMPKKSVSDGAMVSGWQALGEHGHARHGANGGGHVERIEFDIGFEQGQCEGVGGVFERQIECFAVAPAGAGHHAGHAALIAPKRVEPFF